METANLGWKCPGCGRCYGPAMLECHLCNSLIPHIKPEKPSTTLSTGVELGCWANPAGDSLPPSNLTVEEVAEIISSAENKKIFDELFKGLTEQGPNHKIHMAGHKFY